MQGGCCLGEIPMIGRVLLTSLLLAHAAGSEAAKGDRCPPRGHEKTRHCLLVQVRAPTPKRIATVVAMLKKDGFRASRGEGDRHVVLHLNAGELARLFAASYDHRRVAASARDGWVCNAYVKNVRVSARHKAWIVDVKVGHQICE